MIDLALDSFRLISSLMRPVRDGRQNVDFLRDKVVAVGGYTLVEILIGITLFAMLVTLIFGSFSAVFSTAGSIEEQKQISEMANRCLFRITQDLSALYTNPNTVNDAQGNASTAPFDSFIAHTHQTGIGSQELLRFPSRSHLPLNGNNDQGVAIIRYLLRQAGRNEKGPFVLHRSDTLLHQNQDFSEDLLYPTICDQIKSISLRFMDGSGLSHEEWDSSERDFGFSPPEALFVTLVIQGEDSIYHFETGVQLPRIITSEKE